MRAMKKNTFRRQLLLIKSAAMASSPRSATLGMEGRFGGKKVLLTTSGTTALEMAALLCGVQQDDEVIMPSYTFWLRSEGSMNYFLQFLQK